MAVTVHEIPVAFEGPGAGVGELTWGQLGIWRRTEQSGRTMNLVVTVPMEDGTTVAELLGMLRFLLNDRREKTGAGEGDDSVPEPRDVARVLPLSRWYWGRKVPVFDGALFIQVDSEPMVSERRRPGGTPPAVHLEIWTDTRSFAIRQIEAFAREMETVVVEAALGEHGVQAHG
ncbi:hypothetical protein [Catenulispora sp. MAP12-49]|uniref:hypothetical protein n=1 Tax=Catenulispora sp. MAP12-49 TaxID=3156302 RepID=UPI003516ECBF